MKFELKKIDHSKSLSEETPAYTAQVWVDGVHVCDVSNHGHGGCDNQYPAKGKTQADVDALDNLIKTTYPPLKSEYFKDGLPMDLELLCHTELDKIDLVKLVKRDLKSKVMFLKTDGKLYSMSLKGKLTLEQIVSHLKTVADVKSVLNEMTIDEAVAVYQAQ